VTAETLSSAPGQSELDRGRRRLRRAGATSASSLVARGASVASFLLLVPLTVPYLGTERYGIWMTLLSLIALLGITNLGMGNALITLIARTDAAANDEEAGRYVSTAVVLFWTIAISLGLVGAAVLPFVPWHSLFNIPAGPLADEGGRAAVALLVVFFLTIPVGVVGQIRLGYQEGYVTAWLDATASVLGVVGVVVGIAVGAGLPVLVATAAAAPLATGLLNWILLVRARPALHPRVARAGRRHARVLLRSGGLYFALQLAIVVGFSADNFVAAQVLGPAAVTQYAVPSRLALAGVALISVLVLPLWAAYAEALARGDVAWVLRILQRSLIATSTAALAGAVVFVSFGGPIVDAWSRGEVDPGWGLLVGLGLWLVLGSVGSALAMFLNAAHIVRMQVICASLMATANIMLSIVLAKRIGVAGLIWGTVISYTIFVVVPYAVLVPRLLVRLRETSEVKSEPCR
jgi:O-antigen/teichoic acid export membrane protein